jgi:hypothetical protein
VLARRRTQQAIVEIDDASSGFSNLWRWRSAVINAASSSTVIATSCSVMRPPTLIRYMVGGTYRPRHLLSQHLPTWDEWSSPDELIHPGDLWFEHDAQLPEPRFRSRPPIRMTSANDTQPPAQSPPADEINHHTAPGVAEAREPAVLLAAKSAPPAIRAQPINGRLW